MSQLASQAPSGLLLSPALVAAIEGAYATPRRAYHSLTHVLEVIGHFAAVARDVGWDKPREVYLAALFHDAVYVAGAKDNEAASARLAGDAIAAHLASAGIDVARVQHLIELTARHGSLAADQLDRDAALFLDADMAILAADAPAFAAYDRAIRVEYASVPDDLYAAGRRAFFTKLLARPRIYHSAYFYDRCEAKARANIVRANQRSLV